MTENKKNNHHHSTDAKKAAVLGSPGKRRYPIVLTVLALVLIGGAAAVYFRITGATPALSPVTAAAPQSGPATVVSYPVSLFADGKARHFEYRAGDITVRYFILKSADGVIRAAFDACDVCWPEGKGYHQKDDTMVCRNCGRSFSAALINEVKGGCNPAPLKRTVTAGQLTIDVENIVNGKSYFDFSGKV